MTGQQLFDSLDLAGVPKEAKAGLLGLLLQAVSPTVVSVGLGVLDVLSCARLFVAFSLHSGRPRYTLVPSLYKHVNVCWVFPLDGSRFVSDGFNASFSHITTSS
ncbi:unnamed protein product [Ectocarpus sp. 12 AP-2014]